MFHSTAVENLKDKWHHLKIEFLTYRHSYSSSSIILFAIFHDNTKMTTGKKKTASRNQIKGWHQEFMSTCTLNTNVQCAAEGCLILSYSVLKCYNHPGNLLRHLASGTQWPLFLYRITGSTWME